MRSLGKYSGQKPLTRIDLGSRAEKLPRGEGLVQYGSNSGHVLRNEYPGFGRSAPDTHSVSSRSACMCLTSVTRFSRPLMCMRPRGHPSRGNKYSYAREMVIQFPTEQRFYSVHFTHSLRRFAISIVQVPWLIVGSSLAPGEKRLGPYSIGENRREGGRWSF